jgi:hypothetical protein
MNPSHIINTIKNNCDKNSKQQQILTRIQIKFEEIEWSTINKKHNNEGPNMKSAEKSKITYSLEVLVTTLFNTLVKD